MIDWSFDMIYSCCHDSQVNLEFLILENSNGNYPDEISETDRFGPKIRRTQPHNSDPCAGLTDLQSPLYIGPVSMNPLDTE